MEFFIFCAQDRHAVVQLAVAFPAQCLVLAQLARYLPIPCVRDGVLRQAAILAGLDVQAQEAELPPHFPQVANGGLQRLGAVDDDGAHFTPSAKRSQSS